jgi:dipeptidyl aminopeptidase/acylaminoacyl peptidase
MQNPSATPHALARVPLIGQAVAAPHGSHVAYVVEHDARVQIVLLSLAGQPLRTLTADIAPSGARAWGPRDIDWSPDGRLLAFVGGEHGESNSWTVDVETGRLHRMTQYNWADRSPRWSPDGRFLAIVTEVDGVDSVNVVSRDGGWPRRLSDPSFASAEPAWSPDGTTIAFQSNRSDDQRSHNRDIWIVNVASGEERRLTKPDGHADTNPVWSPDGRRIAFVSERNGWKQIWTMTADGRDQQPLAPEDVEQTEPIWSPDGRHLAAVRRVGVAAELLVIDAMTGERAAMPPVSTIETLASLSWFADSDALCAIAGSPTSADDIWKLPLMGEPSRLTNVMPAALRAQRMVDPSTIRFASGDGQEIEALLFTPHDVKPGEGRPGLVYVHGGPTWQVERGWLPEIQHLVGAGYTVLAPNFRGSTGYGRDFDRANDQDWGGGDLDDCVAAAAELRRLAWIASDRIGIWGGSYGGYMTLLALGKHPDVFQAGVDLYGSSDEATLWMQSDTPGRRGIEEEVGVPLLDRERFRAGAPLHYVDRIKAPLLMLHGEDDRRVTLAQSEAMRTALDRLGKVFEYHRYPGEPHGFRKIDNWIDVQDKTVDFLGRFL